MNIVIASKQPPASLPAFGIVILLIVQDFRTHFGLLCPCVRKLALSGNAAILAGTLATPNPTCSKNQHGVPVIPFSVQFGIANLMRMPLLDHHIHRYLRV
jgi:hypothetical protein